MMNEHSRAQSSLDLERLMQARHRAGLRQIQISARLHIGETTYGQWERGQREPSLAKLKDLARLLDVSVDWLLGKDVSIDGYPLREPRAGYAPVIDSAGAALRIADTPAGLRALAEDDAVCAALGITAAEWRMLGALAPPAPLGKEGYLAVLIAVRGHSDRDSAGHR